MKRVLLLGAGLRGLDIYGQWMASHQEFVRVSGVADPNRIRRTKAARLFDLTEDQLYSTADELLDQRIPADYAFICTQDQLHTSIAVKAMEIGYDIILEKPIGVTEEECLTVYKTAKRLDRRVHLCHVLRYTGFFGAIKKSIDEGMIGDIIHIEQSEHISYWHFAHSYVRGNWNREEDSSPIIIAKCCHDLDIINWLLPERISTVASTGVLSWYRGEHAPEGAPKFCLDGCPHSETCSWYAPRLYMRALPLISGFRYSSNRFLSFAGNVILRFPRLTGRIFSKIKALSYLSEWDMWPSTAITDDLSREGKLKALESGSYGRCVFRCDNDVPDHQVVMMQTSSGVTATLTLEGHSYLEGRWVRINGSRGTLEGRFTLADETLTYFDHFQGKRQLLWEDKNPVTGHGGGDMRLMESLFMNSRRDSDSTLEELLQSYRIGFAAERARKTHSIAVIE